MKQMHIAESVLNRLLNFRDEVDAPSVTDAANLMEIAAQTLAELRARPRIKSVRSERDEFGTLRAIPEYEEAGVQLDAALATPTPQMPPVEGVEQAIVTKGLGLEPAP